MVTDALIDSSVIVALVTPEKNSEWASKSIRKYEYLHALDLSFYEVANAIKYKVHNGIEAKNARLAFQNAEKMLNLYTIHDFSEVIGDALKKALELRIAVYDAAFVSLADNLKIPLLTLDMKLAQNLESTKFDELIECPDKIF